ncbi:hypothetical protein EYC84_010148 [Monilinia fructicola]|uniref:Heterokaryon incompatibility domain-containing protein n=1 Tax=Monilinia fructicola TaxID=38448 RepID=A0A5M9JCJ4_MONFR|nr:hypothetical protein EYC84_010148 [Monilinia fructicola]
MPNSDPDSRAEPEPMQHLNRYNTFQEPSIRASNVRNRLRNVINSVTPQRVGTYVYSDINYNEEIRVLRILPGRRKSPICCVLMPSSLPDSNKGSNSTLEKLEYCALSYYWGDDDPEYEVHIYKEPEANSEGSKAALWPFDTRIIQKNLREALLQLRSEHVEVNVWCDALCINQANKMEKAAQVARMHEVYIHAERVCVWLGTSDDQHDLEVLDRIVDDKESREDWMLIINLMKNDWFRRRWVIQELALAKNAWIRYEDQEMKWSEFADAIALFMTKFPTMKQILNKSSNTSFKSLRQPGEYLGALDARALGANTLVTATSRLFRRSDDGKIEQRLLSLEILVSSLLLAFEATDPKDTIFAVLSIAKDTWKMDSELDIGRRWLDSQRRPGVIKVLLLLIRFVVWPFVSLVSTLFGTPSNTSMAVLDPRIQPNYQKCLSDVCADFMEYCIEKSNSLDILCRHWAPKPKPKTARETVQNTKSPCEDENMPSWIPCIDRYAFGSPRKAKMGRINGDSFVDGSGRSQYNASFGLTPRVRFGKRNRLDPKDDNFDLANAGEPDVKPVYAKKQEINQLPPKFDGTMYVEGFQLDIVTKRSDAVNGGVITAEALQMGGWKKDPLTEKHEPSDALWRTLVADRGPDGVNAPNWYRRACAYCLDMSLPHDASGDWNTNDMKMLEKTPAAMLEFLDRVQAVVWKRRFFLTSGEKGKRLFGLMPNEAKEGDVVCIFLGCTVPVVVRKEEEGGKGKGGWRFVGECYVHGMMDGEAVTGDWPKKLEVFRLR